MGSACRFATTPVAALADNPPKPRPIPLSISAIAAIDVMNRRFMVNPVVDVGCDSAALWQRAQHYILNHTIDLCAMNPTIKEKKFVFG